MRFFWSVIISFPCITTRCTTILVHCSTFNIQCSTFKRGHCFDQMLKTASVQRIPFEQASMLHQIQIHDMRMKELRKDPTCVFRSLTKFLVATHANASSHFFFFLVNISYTKLLFFRSTHSSLCFLFLSSESLSIPLLKTLSATRKIHK